MNKLLKPITEDIESNVGDTLTPEIIENVESVISTGEMVDEVTDNLEVVENSAERIEEVVGTQDSNNSTVHENTIKTDIDGDPIVVSDEELPSVVEEQIVRENLVMESVATSLGFRSSLKSSATSQFYSALNINPVKTNLENHGSRKEYVLSKYKVHSEGFFSALGKLGNAIWEGIIKLIQMIKEWLLKFMGFKKDINTFCTQLYKRLESTPDEKIELVVPELSGVSGASIVIALSNPETPFENAYNLFEAITGSVNDYERRQSTYGNKIGDGLFAKIARAVSEGYFSTLSSQIVRRFEGLKKNKLNFRSIASVTVKGGCGYYVGTNNTYGIVVGKSDDKREALIRIYESDITNIEIKFPDAREVKEIAMRLISILLAHIKTYERMSRDADAFMKLIDEKSLLKVDPTASEEAQLYAKKVIAEYVKGTKNIICLPNVYLSAIKKLVSFIEIKK